MATATAKQRNARSISEAMQLCLEHARTKRNLSVERVADRVGLANHWVLYKWMESGRLPAVLIRSFEFACGADYISRFLAHSAGSLFVRIPTGKQTDAKELAALQRLLNTVMSQLLEYRDGEATAEAALAELLKGMEALAYQHGQIEKARVPELDLDGGAS